MKMQRVCLMAITICLPVCLSAAGTPEAIADIYNSSKITDKVNAYINGQKNFIPAPSPAAQKLKSATQYGKITSSVSSLHTTNLKKFNNALPVEMLYLYRSIDATAKMETIKNLHSDLLGSMTQQNIIESEGLMLPLGEEYATSIENEFKKAKK